MEKGGMRVGVSPQGSHGTKRGFTRREREREGKEWGREGGRREMQEELRGRDSVGDADGGTEARQKGLTPAGAKGGQNLPSAL